MAKVNIKAIFHTDLEQVWRVVTDNTDYSWRSDLDRIEVVDDTTFVEYTKDGFPTTFTITCKEEGKRYEFDMVNQNMQGHWTGIFQETEGGVEIDFTEDVKANHPLMNAFAGLYLKKQQKQYIEDLRRSLGI